MLIIGCDFHPGLQQVTIFDNQSGEYQEKRLGHREEAERFYGSLSGPVRVGMEACGHYPWFEHLLEKANSIVSSQPEFRLLRDSIEAYSDPAPTGWAS